MDLSPATISWLQTLVTAAIGALIGGGVSTVTTSRLDKRRWHREDIVYWRTEKRRAYGATLANLIEARDGLIYLLHADGRDHRAQLAESMRGLSERAAPLNFETRMISSTSVEAAIADAAAALDFDYGDPTALSVDRVEEFRDLVRNVRQAMRADLGISDA